MHILVTRPERDARAMKAELEALGHQVTIAALLTVQFLELPQGTLSDALHGADALIATSRNALEALPQTQLRDDDLARPIYCVGNATAALAGRIGFKTVKTGNGTARDLAERIKADATNQTRRFVHLAGEVLAFDLAAGLSNAGIRVGTLTLYRTIEAQTLDAAVVQSVQAGTLDAVILMSPRTGSVWTTLLVKHGLATLTPRLLDSIDHLCLSSQVANTLNPLFIKKISIASRPDNSEMLALVHRIAAISK